MASIVVAAGYRFRKGSPPTKPVPVSGILFTDGSEGTLRITWDQDLENDETLIAWRVNDTVTNRYYVEDDSTAIAGLPGIRTTDCPVSAINVAQGPGDYADFIPSTYGNPVTGLVGGLDADAFANFPITIEER